MSFGPSRRLSFGALGGGLVAGVLALLSGDPQGRLLLGIAAVLLLALGGYDVLLTPRLVATASGLTVRTLALRAELAWSSVSAVRLDERARYGLTSRTLEIDAGPTLVVLGRHSLGREPREAYELVTAFRPS